MTSSSIQVIIRRNAFHIDVRSGPNSTSISFLDTFSKINRLIVPEKVYENIYKGNSVNSVNTTREIHTFIYNKAYHVGKKDKANEFASMWIERTSFITRDEFPGILKWSEVITSSKVSYHSYQ